MISKDGGNLIESLFRKLTGRHTATHDSTQNNRCVSQDLNWTLSKCMCRAIPLRQPFPMY